MSWQTSLEKRPAGGGRRALALVIAAAVAAGTWLAACSDNPNTTRLTAPGGRGDIQGTLTFEGVTGTPLPSAKVIALQKTDCVSSFGAIAVLGTFNGFRIAGADSFLMDELAPCYWVFSDSIPKGQQNLKFVTGNNASSIAFDNPADYGKTGANNGTDPLEGTLDSPAPFDDGNLSVTIPSTGVWTFILNEATSPATYTITQESLVIQSDTRTGMFQIRDLPVGSYDVSIQAEGFLPKTVPSVAVAANRLTDLGTLTMEVASGKLYGTVAFADHPDPRPQATVEVRRANSSVVLETATTDSAYTFTGLETGTYDVVFSAPGYLDTTVVSVQYENGTEVDLGTVTLRPGCQSDYETIQLASDFTSFDLAQAPFMTQGPGCVWTDTVTVQAGGPYNMKFVTNKNFDSPMDYGGDENQTVPLVGTHPVQLVSGTGTAINLTVATTGQYVFVLDESALTFTATRLGGGAAGSVSGSLDFPGIGSAPYPEADVELLASGTQTPVALAQSDTLTREFTITSVEDGTYDLSISAPGFLDTTLVGIQVTGGGNTDVGTVALRPGCVSDFNTIQLASDFTSFTLADAPFMTEGPSCVWTDTVTVDAGGPYNMKFVTNGNYDSPKDYGGNESQTISLAGSHPVKFVSGTGTAINVTVAATGQYVFVLDESALTFSATLLGGGATGSVSGTIGFPGIGSAPYPAANVKLLKSGTQTTVALAQSDTLTRRFTMTSLEDGTYDLKITATGFLDTTVTGITVSGGAAVDVGTVTLEAGCVSQFTTIQLASDFTSFTLADAPFMTRTSSCVWTDTVRVDAGTYNMKFVTNGNYDSPKDYGGDESQNIPLVGTHPVKFVSGTGTAINVTVAATGQYVFVLDESALTFSATPLGGGATGSVSGTIGFPGIDSAPYPAANVKLLLTGTQTTVALAQSDTLTRRFSITSVADGTYDLKITATGFLDTTLTGVAVSGGAAVDVGTVTLEAGCVSQFATIQLASDFTSFTLADAPFMTHGPSCVWTDTVTVQAGGPYNMKFVTDGNYDSPKDYGGDESQTLALVGTHPVRLVSGTGTAIHVTVAETGQYEFLLDESTLTFTASLLAASPSGSITGTVGFSGLDSGPYPEAKVELFPSGGSTPVSTVMSDDTTRVFTFPSVLNGTYDVKVSANCFITEQLTSVNVNGAAADVGTVTLSAGTSAFTTIQMVGDFNGYDLAAAPYMTEAPACVWSDTLDLSGLGAGASQYFKFVTNNTFDSPPDYGGDESKLLSIPGTYPVIPVTSGNYIQIQVNQPGLYIFTLDERRQTFSAVRYTP